MSSTEMRDPGMAASPFQGVGASMVTLKVTPEQLVEQANNVSDKISAAKRSYSRICDNIRRTSSYWKGEAADTHRKIFDLLDPTMEEIFTHFTEHADDLRAMSGVYTQVAIDVAGEISSLSGDAIQ